MKAKEDLSKMVNELYVRKRKGRKNKEIEEEWEKKEAKISRNWQNPRDTGALIVVTHHQCPSTVCAVLILERGCGGGG